MSINDLPNLQSFFIDDLPSNLLKLLICKARGIWWNTTWEHLTSLSELCLLFDDIVKGKMKTQVPFLPTNLISLEILLIEDITYLDCMWLQHLTFLHKLKIFYCSQAQVVARRVVFLS